MALEIGRVYQDRNGFLCFKAAPGVWLFDVNCPRSDGMATLDTVVASYDPENLRYGGLTPRPDLDIGFYKKETTNGD